VRTARAQAEVPLAPGHALRLWSDLRRWPSFVEGFAHLIENDPGWPAPDSRVVWESVPAGRGRVTEKVVQSDPYLLATMVFEDRLAGRQTFRTAPSDGGSAVELELEYTLVKYGPFGPVADALFIRRALRDSLHRTLFRFAIEAEEEAGLR
jgi:polyketide cyclase/dehydrase/lipid transport protein